MNFRPTLVLVAQSMETVVCQRLPRLQGIWEVDIGEELSCQRENGIRTDPFAVAVVKSVEGITVIGIIWTNW